VIEDLTSDSAATEIRMLRLDARYQGAIMLVEGATDARLFENLVASPQVTIRWLDGKERTLAVLKLLEQANERGVIAVVDADFWHLDGIPAELGENVMFTDTHDMDLMIFSSPASRKVASEYYYDANAQRRLDDEFPELKRALLGAAKLVGYLRWINHKQQYGLSFRNSADVRNSVDLRPAFAAESRTFQLDKLLELICPDNRVLREQLRMLVSTTKLHNYDALYLCNGHDVMQITCFMIEHNGRKHLRQKLNPLELETIFRLAYERRFFEQTKLYQKLLVWQRQTGFKIF
jgi:hypothetical protein